jgi:hypothetical protein
VKKPKYVAPRMYVREMVDGPDLDRMLASGSHVLAVLPKKPSAHCIAQKEYLQRRFAAGYKKLEILLPEHFYSFLQSRLRDGESMASLLERLILSSGDNSLISIGEADK